MKVLFALEVPKNIFVSLPPGSDRKSHSGNVKGYVFPSGNNQQKFTDLLFSEEQSRHAS